MKKSLVKQSTAQKILLFAAAGSLLCFCACQSSDTGKAKTPSQKEQWEKSIRNSYGKWTPGSSQEETSFAASSGEYIFVDGNIPGETKNMPPNVLPTPAEQAKLSRSGHRPSAVHTVAKGETLWGIARKYYGQGWKWDKIKNANMDRLKKGTVIHPGLVLVIPSIRNTEEEEKRPLEEKKEEKKLSSLPGENGKKKTENENKSSGKKAEEKNNTLPVRKDTAK